MDRLHRCWTIFDTSVQVREALASWKKQHIVDSKALRFTWLCRNPGMSSAIERIVATINSKFRLQKFNSASRRRKGAWRKIIYNRDGRTCSIEESFAESQKRRRAAKSICSVNTNSAKMQVLHKMTYSNWNATNALFISTRFLFDLLVSENLDDTVLKLCEECSFVRVARHFDELHYREWKFTAKFRAKYRIESYTGCLSSGYLLSGTFRQIPAVEWYWLKPFRARCSCVSVSFISTTNKFVTNGWRTGQPSPTTLTLNGFTRNARMVFIPANGEIWIATPPVALLCIFVCFHFVVCNCLLVKSICFHSDIGKMTQYFLQYVSLKKIY